MLWNKLDEQWKISGKFPVPIYLFMMLISLLILKIAVVSKYYLG